MASRPKRRPLWPAAFVTLFAAAACLQTSAQAPPLADAAVLLKAQQASLGASSGDLVLSQPSRLGTGITLAAGQNLDIRAPLTIGPATVTLAGHNTVTCSAPVTVENAINLFVADSATGIAVHNCTVTVIGKPGGTLLTATHSAGVQMTGNHAVNMALFTTRNGSAAQASTDVTITTNSADFPKGGGPIGIYLLYVVGGTVSGNKLHGTGHGVEWWGGDANQYWPGFDKVTGAGRLRIDNNQCDDAGGACVWGSDGFDIQVDNNTAVGCSDVCFDTEGGVRTSFSHNNARRCGNGCYAAEFESQNASFTANTGYADSKNQSYALVLIKHPSGRVPGHEGLVISGNTFNCGDPCRALFSEGEDGSTFADNHITNGVVIYGYYDHDAKVQNNVLLFTQPPAGGIAVQGPTLFQAHTSEISGNTIVDQSPDHGGTCILQSWSDYNDVDTMRITGNTCNGFATGIHTITAGGNPGAPHAMWDVSGNQFIDVPAAQQLVHEHKSGNEVYNAGTVSDKARKAEQILRMLPR